jgi:hypothetical protein
LRPSSEIKQLADTLIQELDAALVTPVLAPTTLSGLPWTDDTVKGAVKLVEAHHPRTLEKTPQGWRLTMTDGKTVMVER